MKYTALLIMWAILPCAAQGIDRVRLLEAENKALRSQIDAMRVEIAAFKSEIKQINADNAALRKRLPAAKIDTATKQPAATQMTSQSSTYKYRGSKRSRQWFEAQYSYFRDKIVLLKGRFYDVGKDRLKKSAIWQEPPTIGSLRWAKAGSPFRKTRILQALKKDEAIVRLRIRGIDVPGRVVFFHVKGIDPAKNLDDVEFSDKPLIYVGKYSYISSAMIKKTVQSYHAFQPLTRKEFADLLANEFQLFRYKKIIKKVRVSHLLGGGGFGAPRTGWHIEEKVKIITSPVP